MIWTNGCILQNTTFGGIQGFTRPPSTPWTKDDGSFAGIVHQERNWTFALFKGAGHLIPQQQPAAVCNSSPNSIAPYLTQFLGRHSHSSESLSWGTIKLVSSRTLVGPFQSSVEKDRHWSVMLCQVRWIYFTEVGRPLLRRLSPRQRLLLGTATCLQQVCPSRPPSRLRLNKAVEVRQIETKRPSLDSRSQFSFFVHHGYG